MRGRASWLWREEEDMLELDRIVPWRGIASYSTSHEFRSTYLTSLNGVVIPPTSGYEDHMLRSGCKMGDVCLLQGQSL